MRDLHNNVKILTAIEPVAVGTTGTGKTSGAIDRQGYDSLEFDIAYGAVTATAAAFTVALTESDLATSGFTAVADADLLGTELLAGLAAAVRVDGSTEKVTKKIGYIGNKRYVKVQVSSTTTAGTPIGVNAILGNPSQSPVA